MFGGLKNSAPKVPSSLPSGNASQGSKIPMNKGASYKLPASGDNVGNMLKGTTGVGPGPGTSSDNLGNMLKELGDNDGVLKYVHKVKSNKVTDFNELANQVSGQVDAMNRIIENEGMSGLKNRINSYNKG
ncbi:hypothetical protein [Clostridium butanoliproducens]|uniref:hypothetical protein n=1 Tax=Clostridium butanoliproducens TaxID=2991837 RepID=UPI0024BB4FDB|nr:hypothetical protein [Clostridium butanoliproducens]